MTSPAPTIDLDRLVAIDVHTHAEVSANGHPSLSPELMAASAAYLKAHGHRQPTIPEMAAHYRERNMAAVVFTVDAESATGHPPIANEEVAATCAEHADVLIPFASLDPWRGKAGVRQARRLVEEFGVRGFKFHPSIQGSRHPAVADCAVIGVPDEKWGEVGRAVVVRAPDADSVDEADLLAFLDGRLARYKIPKSVVLADAVPRNATGKILKPLLRERFG